MVFLTGFHGQAGGQALEEGNGDVIRRRWGGGYGGGQLPHVVGRSGVRVLEDARLVRNVEQVLIGRPGLRSRLEDRHALLLSVLQ